VKSSILCHRCGFPVKRGAVPFIWHTDETASGMAAFCSVFCLETTIGRPYPDPPRSALVAAEDRKHNKEA